jgi:hypothetical protein
MVASVPKAIWRDEEVRSYQAGVLQTAWLVRRDADNAIRLEPAVIRVPLAEGQVIARSEAGAREEERQ